MSDIKHGKLLVLTTENIKTMRKVLLFTLIPVLLFAQGPDDTSLDVTEADNQITAVADDGEGWLKNYDEAMADAKKEGRNVLVYFTGSDWCPPCKLLKKDLFDTAAFKTISANYTLLYIDIPRNRELLSPEQMKHNSEVLNKINKKAVFPLLIVMNEKGSKLDQYSGYSMNGEVQYHMELLEKYKD